jgi:AraC-like DNA-binding protein
MRQFGALHYLERLGEPFLFLEERMVIVSPGQRHVVVNHLPKAVFVLEGVLRHASPGGAPEMLNPGSVLLNFQKRRNTYLPPEGAESGKIRVLRLTLPWDFQKRRKAEDRDGFGAWMAEALPASGVLHLAEGEEGARRIHELRECLVSRDAGRRYRANAVARLIFLELARSRSQTRHSPDATAALLAGIEAYLENHLERPLALSDVARALDRSEEHLARLFRSHRRLTIFQELRRLRIKRAQYLLLCSDLAINRIAEQTGFATLAHFSRAFKEDTGQTPSAYRLRSGFRVEQGA